MTPPIPPMILHANFDVDQLSDQLQWRFSRADGQGNPPAGTDAGTVYFTEGETFKLQVTAGRDSAFETFEVIDCCLISRPRIVQLGVGLKTLFAAPSPFVAPSGEPLPGATCQIPGSEFVPVSAAQAGPGHHQVVREWDGYLKAGPNTGRWELEFVITVRITGADGQSWSRVFSFDPESEVGTGMTPPDVQC